MMPLLILVAWIVRPLIFAAAALPGQTRGFGDVCDAVGADEISNLLQHKVSVQDHTKAVGNHCVAPGTCAAPSARNKVVLDIKPRLQWNSDGGFCGAMSLQVAAMGHGAWISQDLIRKANTHGEGHGDAQNGYELLPSNVAETARNLKLKYDEWDYMKPKPQVDAYKRWIKSHLASREPVVIFPMSKGKSHIPYPSSNPNEGYFDHIEPVIGFGTNHALDDTKVYSDDWLLHFSNQDLQTYYRNFSSLEDDTLMQGNCKNALPGFGRNEMYPCIFNRVGYGLAITGLETSTSTQRVVLDVDRQSEPNVRLHEKPENLFGTVQVFDLKKGLQYILYRFKGTMSLPSSDFDGDYEHKKVFEAADESWTYEDPNPMISNGAYYYVVAQAQR